MGGRAEYYLNVFKTVRQEHASTKRGDATRDRIFDMALKLFRKGGFETTTMREVARSAKVSLGAAYYYFPSKEALVHAFYDRVQQTHREKVEATCGCTDDLLGRVQAALVSKLDVVNDDRVLLGALFRFAGDADHPLSVFGESTRGQRDAAMSTFERALDGAQITAPLRNAAARALWLVHLGLLLYFIHDRSEGQALTRRLASQTAEWFCSVIRLASLPGASLMLEPLLKALAEAGLMPFQSDTTEVSQ